MAIDEKTISYLLKEVSTLKKDLRDTNTRRAQLTNKVDQIEAAVKDMPASMALLLEFMLGSESKREEVSNYLIHQCYEEEEKPSLAPVGRGNFTYILQILSDLEEAIGDLDSLLYQIVELEAALGKLEEIAREGQLKYEARLAGSLRDICRIHDPMHLSETQIKSLVASVQVLIKEWGQLNREKANWTCSKLLEVGLTWLPVTEKAQKDIADAKKSAGIDG